MMLAPSILSADFGRLAEEVQAAERGGAGLVHVDVMDGHFVPNLTVGPAVVKAVRRATRLPIDVHLMIESADRFLDAFRDAGADWIDGGIDAGNARGLVEAGAEILVAGNAVFGGGQAERDARRILEASR